MIIFRFSFQFHASQKLTLISISGWYKDMELIVTSAIGCQIGQDPHGLRLVKVQETEVEHAYHGLDVCPTNITFKNSDSSI